MGGCNLEVHPEGLGGINTSLVYHFADTDLGGGGGVEMFFEKLGGNSKRGH